MYQEPKKLAELQLGVRNFCGDFNARNKENGLKWALKNVIDAVKYISLSMLKSKASKDW